jgi:hypothetical protein
MISVKKPLLLYVSFLLRKNVKFVGVLNKKAGYEL